MQSPAEFGAWVMPTNKASLDAFNAVMERAAKRTKPTNAPSFTNLPECVLSHACSFLPAGSLLRACGVCKLLQTVSYDDTLWRDLCIVRWPSTLGLAVRSYLKFYQQRKGKLAAQNEPQREKLSDYTLLFDVSSTVDGRKVQLCSKAVSLTGMAVGAISVAFSVPWRAVKPMTKYGSGLSSPIDAPIIEGLILRNSDSKTLLVSSQVVDDGEDDGSTSHLYYPSEPLATQAQWFDNAAPDVWFEGGWNVVIEAPDGVDAVAEAQPGTETVVVSVASASASVPAAAPAAAPAPAPAPPAPPPPPATAARPIEPWSCDHCTYLNFLLTDMECCSMCRRERPAVPNIAVATAPAVPHATEAQAVAVPVHGAIETKGGAAMANITIELQLRTFAEYGDIHEASNEQVLQFLGHAAKWS
jgi:hypothetical protein